MNTEEFTELAKTDIEKWVNIFITLDDEEANNSGYSNNELINDVGEWDNLYRKNGKYGLKLVLAASEGGYEGGGEYTERVFAIVPAIKKYEKYKIGYKDNAIVIPEAILYFKKTGNYNSHDGVEWDEEISIVEPTEVTIIQFK